MPKKIGCPTGTKMIKGKCVVVKGGETIQYPWGSYRTGYDIVKQGDIYFMQVMNGPFRIFEGPKQKTMKQAEEVGIKTLKKANPRLAHNVGV